MNAPPARRQPSIDADGLLPPLRPIPTSLALVLLGVTAAFGGCVQLGSDHAGQPKEVEVIAPSAIQQFLGNGELVPVSSAPGRPEYILTGSNGGEPNVGITSSGTIFVNSLNVVLRSRDNGAHWQRVREWPLLNFDPMMWVDPVTNRVYQAPMFPVLTCASIAWTEDEGDTWFERTVVCPLVQPFDGHKLTSGRPGPATPAGLARHPTVLYLCYNMGIASTGCLMSYDGGLTWPVNRPVWGTGSPGEASGCAGSIGQPLASPDGTMVIPKAWDCDGLYLVYTRDSGLTWEVSSGPKVGGETINPAIAFSTNGTLYATWQGNDHLTYLASTKDLGKTWAGPWIVSPPDVGSTVFAAIGAGHEDRVALAFLGTRDTREYPSDAPARTHWHLFIVTTEDGGAENPLFTAYQATPGEDPVQVGPVWIGGGGDPSRNMLDFIQGAVAPDGTFYVAYTEGCTGGCVNRPTASSSRSDETSVGVLRNWRLYQANASMPATPASDSSPSPFPRFLGVERK